MALKRALVGPYFFFFPLLAFLAYLAAVLALALSIADVLPGLSPIPVPSRDSSSLQFKSPLVPLDGWSFPDSHSSDDSEASLTADSSCHLPYSRVMYKDIISIICTVWLLRTPKKFNKFRLIPSLHTTKIHVPTLQRNLIASSAP